MDAYHSGGGGVHHGSHGCDGKVGRFWGRVRRNDCDGGPGQDYGKGKGRDHNAGGEEPGKLPAGVAGGVLTVPLGYEGGDGGEEVEDNHGEGVPVAEKHNLLPTEDKDDDLLELWESTG